MMLHTPRFAPGLFHAGMTGPSGAGARSMTRHPLSKRPLALSTSALHRPHSSEDTEMFTHAACLLLRREVLNALGEPSEIARPLACPLFGWARGTIKLEFV